jgi:hypothetical protein
VPSSPAGCPDGAALCRPAATCQAVAHCPARRRRDSRIHHRSPHFRGRLGSDNPVFTLRIALHTKRACGRPASRDVPTGSEPVPLSRSQPTRRRHRSAAWVDVCQGGLERGAGRHTKVRSHQKTITEHGPEAPEPWSRQDGSRARQDRQSSFLGCRSGGPSGPTAWGGRSRTCLAPPASPE